MRWGLIGASDIAATRMIPALRAAGQQLTAVASGDAEHGRAFAGRNDIAVTTSSVEQLLGRADVDAVYISSRNDRHAEQALASIAAGKHVLCEKPLALTLDDAAALLEAAEHANVVFAVNHHLPGAATHQTIRRLVADGAVGALLAVNVAHAVLLPERLRGWRLGTGDGAGVILDITCHDASVINAIVPVPATAATAIGVSQGGWSAGSPDAVMSVIRYGDDVLAQTHDAFTVGCRETRIEVYGTEGAIIATDVMTQDPKGSVVLRTAAGERPVSVGERRDLYLTVLEGFSAAVADGSQPTVTGAEGANAVAVALAVQASALTGQTATIDRWFTGDNPTVLNAHQMKASHA
jgi:1,5-anhydro-D-fructose reductase (1,5-anhydro-D-mannitol-forming)